LINKEKAILIRLDSSFSLRISFFHSLFSLFFTFFWTCSSGIDSRFWHRFTILDLCIDSFVVHTHRYVSLFFFFSACLYLRFLHACLWVNWQGWIILDKDNGELFQLYSCFLRTSRIFLNTWIKKLVKLQNLWTPRSINLVLDIIFVREREI